MFVDMHGNARIKLCMHLHSTRSTGTLTPSELEEAYAAEGYDAIAITDSWVYGDEREAEGLLVLSGIQCDVGVEGGDGYRIVGVGMTSDPQIPEDWKNMKRTAAAKTAQIADKIRLYNGFSFVVPSAEATDGARRLLSAGTFDGIEIFTPDLAAKHGYGFFEGVVNELAKFGSFPSLVASDDAENGEMELFGGAVMVLADEMTGASIVRALKAGRFYATEGPEVHLSVSAGGRVSVDCSPCSKIELFTGSADTEGKLFEGEGLIGAQYSVKESDRYVRAQVTDATGARAWTNYVIL